MVSDGKAGHVNQSLGLAEALQRLLPDVEIREIPALTRLPALKALLAPTPPDEPLALVIGAGHGTHLTLLAAARASACRSVVLMGPSLPDSLFDLCIVPRHDGGAESSRRWFSDGPLNRMQPGTEQSGGVILIGGPSPHYHWDEDLLVEELTRICDGQTRWQLSSSRRTPAGFLHRLRDAKLPLLEIHAVDGLPAGWLASTLPATAQCWVTPDSASMVYEALTAGCAVGVHGLAPKAGSRVAGAIGDLTTRGLVTAYAAFAAGADLQRPSEAFAEADRCARRLTDEGWLC